MPAGPRVAENVPRDAARVAAVRRFSRFYTRRIGLLQEGLLDSGFTLTEARVIWELGHAPATTASAVAAALGLDHGYLSRILRGFVDRGLVGRTPSSADARQSLLDLTESGRAACATLEARSDQLVGGMLATVPAPAQARIVAAMHAIEATLEPAAAPPAVVLRQHRPGDMGFVLESHARCYAEEYGWGAAFEALVADIVAGFLRDFDPVRERCWIAEADGVRAGSVVLVNGGDDVAKLRLLLVEVFARGTGIGRRLVDECIAFARTARYRRISLWTQSILVGARAIYQDAGFRLVGQEPHCRFGVDLVGETWELDL